MGKEFLFENPGPVNFRPRKHTKNKSHLHLAFAPPRELFITIIETPSHSMLTYPHAIRRHSA